MAVIPIINSSNVVVNIIELEPGAIWQPPGDCTIGIEGGEIGWIWDGEKYYDPNPPPPVKEPVKIQANTTGPTSLG